MDCLFCKIINKEIPTEFLYEDDKVVAFNDIDPQAPIHFLIVPKEHIESNDDINDENSHIVSHVFQVAKKLAKENGLKSGYRIVNNCKEDGGQSVNHIHFHVLGGRQMLWPPG
ncbi:histidine triad nucleotide-binding protein [Paratissierella segnis]|jgi:histidine triad (HIT) family protein|uniref:Histidine triad nucleotide-binding protein n=1 Tax=Paratissierella segnis TaxID=2763679 RepID=A0A926EY61_9FIRM|nr:histidine triad nucleotide-binding protein [Paratissierella segnis]MBC8588385.1 histidine triad nucleotide-binding protein [Paratissierella segnis]